MILVTGATGTVGRELVAQLAGHPVRALTRNPAKAAFPQDVEVVRGDLDDPASLGAAMRGVDRVFVLTPGHEQNVVAAARAAGVKRLVKLSTTGVEFDLTDAISAEHRAGEQVIRESGLRWTILRPGTFMSNRYAWLGSVQASDTVHVTEGDPVSAAIHPRDVAAVAALVLTSEGHDGAVYPLTGGEALSPAEQVDILAKAVGRPLRLVHESEAETRARFESFGWGGPGLDALFELKRQSADCDRIVFDTVERLTGRPPLTFADWAAEATR